MRNLQASDIFSFCRVINAIGIKDEVKKIAMKADKLSDINKADAGFDLIFCIFEKATKQKSEDALFEFFAGIFEEEIDVVRAMDPVEFIDKAMEAADVEKWKAFFGRVAALMKKKS